MGSGNRSIRFKIFLLLLIPLLTLSALWGFVLNLTVGDGLALLRAGKMYDTIGATSTDLGLQIQAERALAADALSTGLTGSPAFTGQQAKTSAAVDKFEKVARDGDTRGSLGQTLTASLDDLLDSLDHLGSIRESIAQSRVSRLEAVTAYNSIMDELFAVYERLGSVPDLDIFQQAGAMQAMGNAQEMISREDALIRGALAKGEMTKEEHDAFSEWVSTRRFLYQKNRPILEDGMRAPYEAVLSSQLFGQFAALENRVVDQVRSGGELPANTDQWKTTVDALILKLDDARMKASDALKQSSDLVATGIVARIAVAGILGLAAVVATIIFSLRFGRRFVRDLSQLRHAALELADVRLPRVVERLQRGEEVDVEAEAPPIQAGGSVEVEDVAQAFSAVQRTAVEAAVGHANLRRGVNEVFLNLARRKQGLLHRQLTLLDAMQRRDNERENLEDLFRLDHLTTRMRRHAEGLIILSGAAPNRSWRQPVPLMDVVRAATSEVEDYTRVAVAPLPNASLAGAAVADIVHLIAELLENATIFSPPQAKVQVRGEPVANGLVLEIEDRGLGLAPEEYAAINDRLANPPEFDLADSDRLGLFVVGQLAARNGVGVILRASPYGGTTSIVLIPRSLMAGDGTPTALPGSITAAVTSGTTAAVTSGSAPAIAGPAAAALPGSTASLPGSAAAPSGSASPPGSAAALPGSAAALPGSAAALSGPALGPAGESLTSGAFTSARHAATEEEPDADRSGPETSPFFTPAALRTEPAPSAARNDIPEDGPASGFGAVGETSAPSSSVAPSATPDAASSGTWDPFAAPAAAAPGLANPFAAAPETADPFAAAPETADPFAAAPETVDPFAVDPFTPAPRTVDPFGAASSPMAPGVAPDGTSRTAPEPTVPNPLTATGPTGPTGSIGTSLPRGTSARSAMRPPAPATNPLAPVTNPPAPAATPPASPSPSLGTVPSSVNGTHAGLPRRVRQANIAPQLRERAQAQPPSAPTAEERSPEDARAMFSAFQRGARRGREEADGGYSHNMYGEKGDE